MYIYAPFHYKVKGAFNLLFYMTGFVRHINASENALNFFFAVFLSDMFFSRAFHTNEVFLDMLFG